MCIRDSVLDDEERLVEKDLLAFPERDAVQPPVLVEVPPIPIEADTTIEGRYHDPYSVYRGHIHASTGNRGHGLERMSCSPIMRLPERRRAEHSTRGPSAC